MKHNKVVAVIIFIFGLLVFAQQMYCQDVPSPDTIKKIRALEIERDFYKKQTENKEELLTETQSQSDKWKALYYAEKERADNTRQAEIDALAKERDEWKEAFEESQKSNKNLFTSNEAYKQQSIRDEQELKRLERRVSSLKKQRLLFGIVGFGAGTAFGARIQF